MAKEFDATTRHLIEANPRAWLKYIGISGDAPATVIDSDLSTVTAEADKVIRVDDKVPWLVHLEMQANYDATLGLRMARYNILLEVRHKLPVLSVAILLRRLADGPTMTGLWQRKLPDGFCSHDFRYRVIRAWEQRADETLAGDMAILPLAPLADDAKDRLSEIFARLGKRFEAERELAERQALWNCTLGLAGLRYSKELIMTLSQEQSIMEESSYYHGILEKGEAKGGQRLLLRVGTKRFGEPGPKVRAAIDQIQDLAALEELAALALDVTSWQELLPTK
jgi:predicted transposase YdaD